MQTRPRVSIVVPTYNHAHFLEAALDSVRAQTMGDWECIVVNNFSEDDTEAVVASFADPRVRMINFRNQGIIAASRNVGIREAAADWVAFLDSDDVWEPEKLERCLAVAEADGADLVSHPELFLRDGRTGQCTEVATPRRTTYTSLLLDGNCLSPSAVLVRRQALLRVGGFCEDREVVTAEDAELWLRLAADGIHMASAPEALGYYRIHGAQNVNAVERHMNASLTVLDRHYPRLGVTAPCRYRRARARIIYAAGRTQQKLGRGRAALALLGRAFLVWPFLPRLPVAALLVVAAWFRRH
jgi:glycosyltransferase involved in cell wall biosynthesis